MDLSCDLVVYRVLTVFLVVLPGYIELIDQIFLSQRNCWN